MAGTSSLVYTLSSDGTYYIVGTGFNTIEDLNYHIDELGYGTEGSGLDNTWTGGDLVIPATYNGLPVLGVASQAFQNITNITSVTFEGNVQTLGIYTFFGCSSLTNVTLSNSLNIIGNNVFVGTSIVNITIPASVSSIHQDAFNTSSLQTIIFEGNNPCGIQQYSIYTNTIIYVPTLTRYRTAWKGIAGISLNNIQRIPNTNEVDYAETTYVSSATSVTNTIYCEVGEQLLASVVYRSTFTAPSGWTLVTSAPMIDNGSIQQWLAIYSKIATSTTETFTALVSNLGRIYLSLINIVDRTFSEIVSLNGDSSVVENGQIQVTNTTNNELLYFIGTITSSTGTQAVGYTITGDYEIFNLSASGGRLTWVYNDEPNTSFTLTKTNGSSLFNQLGLELVVPQPEPPMPPLPEGYIDENDLAKFSTLIKQYLQSKLPAETYTITTNVTNGTYSGSATITWTGTESVTISANTGYELPETITVIGASYTYNSSTGVISLYNATGNVTISAECESSAPQGLIAYATAQSGVTYTAVSDLTSYTDAQINDISKAISNCADITSSTQTVYLSDATSISVGATRSYTLSTQEAMTDRILGFNHDTLTSSTAYGEATATGKAGITWQMVNCLATRYKMNSSSTNAGGWNASLMRTSTLPTVKLTLPQDLQGIIKLVDKKAANGGSSNYSATITSSDDLFLLCEKEIFSSITWAQDGSNEGTQYAYWASHNQASDRIKYYNNAGTLTTSFWWSRSSNFDLINRFCGVGASGNVFFTNASDTRGVAFAYCT